MALQNSIQYEPLPREEVVKAVERRKPSRVPLVRAKWLTAELRQQYGAWINELDRFPEDVVDPERFLIIDYKNMGLSWEIPVSGALDAAAIVDDWAKLDEFVQKLPNPENDERIERIVSIAEQAHAENRYLMHTQWSLFYERPWQIRGMQNLLIDYCTNPEKVHVLNRALCDFYIKYIRVVGRKLKPDGFWTSDDLGHQTQLMMSPKILREFIKPYYVEIGKALKEQNMHWWMHSCGNNTEVLGDLADVGVDVFHPVQKGAMDEVSVAHDFGDRLVFCAGIDIQHVLQEKSVQEVRNEVRFLIDTFDRPEGGMCIAAGNGIVEGTPFENIEAFLDEALRYGTIHRNCMNDSR